MNGWRHAGFQIATSFWNVSDNEVHEVQRKRQRRVHFILALRPLQRHGGGAEGCTRALLGRVDRCRQKRHLGRDRKATEEAGRTREEGRRGSTGCA